jgi:hypothetical protein
MAWQAECLRMLLASNLTELKVVVTPTVSPRSATRGWASLTSDMDGIALRIYQRLTGKASRAKRMVDMTKELEGIEQLSCEPILKGKFSQYFSDEDVARVRGHDLDFLLRFGFNIIRGEILNSARYGVWSFHHDDESKYRGGPPAFWEIYQNDPKTGAILQRLTNRLDGGIVLYKGYFPTIKYSWHRNCDQVLFGSAEWPLRVCRDILNGCADRIEGEPSATKAPIFSRPTNWQTARAVVKMSAAWVRHQIQDLLTRERWHVGIVRAPIHSFLRSGPAPKIEWLPDSPRTRFIADPFAIKRGAEITLLVEDFDQIRRKGCIAAIRSTDDGRSFSEPTPISGGIFDHSDHKSYPYLFEHDGEIYCVPETHERNEIALYRAIRFPNQWERVCALLEGVAGIDPTVFQHDGNWWMFYADRERGSNVKLHLASAPSLEGPWIAHPANPVKTDIGGARPGGTPFVHDGVLYRPAQDSTRTYGGALVIHRVTKLTQTQYEEEVACRLMPERNGRYPHAFHTLAAAGNICVADGKRYVVLPQVIPALIREKFRSFLGAFGKQ